MPDAFNPRTDTIMHFIHDSLFGVGGLEDLIAHEMPFPKCIERHDTDKHLGRWACDAAEWVLAAATKHPEIMAALNERAKGASDAEQRLTQLALASAQAEVAELRKALRRVATRGRKFNSPWSREVASIAEGALSRTPGSENVGPPIDWDSPTEGADPTRETP